MLLFYHFLHLLVDGMEGYGTESYMLNMLNQLYCERQEGN